MNFIKKQRTGFYIYVVAGLLALIGMIVYVASVNVSRNEFNTSTVGPVIALAVLSIVCVAAEIVIEQMKTESGVIDIVKEALKVAAAIMLCSIIGFILFATVDPMAQAYMSDFRNEDVWLFEALSMAIGGIVLTGISAAFVIVGSFFRVRAQA